MAAGSNPTSRSVTRTEATPLWCGLLSGYLINSLAIPFFFRPSTGIVTIVLQSPVPLDILDYTVTRAQSPLKVGKP
jgi:hypothetical protein